MGARTERRWTGEEEYYLLAHIDTWRIETIAHALGRSPKAVRQFSWRARIYPTKQFWVTSGEASRRSGITPQGLTQMARQGRIKARRVPGGKWWLFDPAGLPRKEEPCPRKATA